MQEPPSSREDTLAARWQTQASGEVRWYSPIDGGRQQPWPGEYAWGETWLPEFPCHWDIQLRFERGAAVHRDWHRAEADFLDRDVVRWLLREGADLLIFEGGKIVGQFHVDKVEPLLPA